MSKRPFDARQDADLVIVPLIIAPLLFIGGVCMAGYWTYQQKQVIAAKKAPDPKMAEDITASGAIAAGALVVLMTAVFWAACNASFKKVIADLEEKLEKLEAHGSERNQKQFELEWTVIPSLRQRLRKAEEELKVAKAEEYPDLVGIGNDIADLFRQRKELRARIANDEPEENKRAVKFAELDGMLEEHVMSFFTPNQENDNVSNAPSASNAPVTAQQS